MFGRNFAGRGRGGGGGGLGFGFRGSSPLWPYSGLGRGGLPRCGYYFGGGGAPVPWSYPSRPFSSGMPSAPGYAPYSPQMTRGEELNYMKDQAGEIKQQLEEIESRMRNLEAKE